MYNISFFFGYFEKGFLVIMKLIILLLDFGCKLVWTFGVWKCYYGLLDRGGVLKSLFDKEVLD